MGIPTSQNFGKESSPRAPGVFRPVITRTTQIDARRVFVQWILRKPSEGDGYSFAVYRSGSAEGPWEELVTDLVDTYLFVDEKFPAPSDSNDANLMSLSRTVYYRVVVSHAVDGTAETIKTLEGGLDRRRRAMVKKLRRDAELKIRKGSGTEVAIIKRKWWGEPCTCKSKSGVVTRAHCSVCHGTGIIDGYWNPVHTFGKRTATALDTATDTSGTAEVSKILATVPYIPHVEVKDILVFMRDDRRFIVEKNNQTEIHSVVVHQELLISELARTSREYRIEVDNWHTPAWF